MRNAQRFSRGPSTKAAPAFVGERASPRPGAIQETADQPEDSPASYLAGGCSTLSSLNRRSVTEVAPRRSLLIVKTRSGRGG